MFIPISAEEDNKVIEPSSNKITLALVGDMSNVIVTLQQSDGNEGWNTVVIDGVDQVLNSTNTLISIYAPVVLNVNKSAGSACGVAIYTEKNK